VEVSLKDVNRIICPVEVGNVIFSKEKQMQVKVDGRNVFVKFIPVSQSDPTTGQSVLVYSTLPRDLLTDVTHIATFPVQP
jgi:phosphosulfolactate synthase (CoM biosynthesis protein A)